MILPYTVINPNLLPNETEDERQRRVEIGMPRHELLKDRLGNVLADRRMGIFLIQSLRSSRTSPVDFSQDRDVQAILDRLRFSSSNMWHYTLFYRTISHLATLVESLRRFVAKRLPSGEEVGPQLFGMFLLPSLSPWLMPTAPTLARIDACVSGSVGSSLVLTDDLSVGRVVKAYRLRRLDYMNAQFKHEGPQEDQAWDDPFDDYEPTPMDPNSGMGHWHDWSEWGVSRDYKNSFDGCGDLEPVITSSSFSVWGWKDFGFSVHLMKCGEWCPLLAHENSVVLKIADVENSIRLYFSTAELKRNWFDYSLEEKCNLLLSPRDWGKVLTTEFGQFACSELFSAKFDFDSITSVSVRKDIAFPEAEGMPVIVVSWDYAECPSFEHRRVCVTDRRRNRFRPRNDFSPNSVLSTTGRVSVVLLEEDAQKFLSVLQSFCPRLTHVDELPEVPTTPVPVPIPVVPPQSLFYSHPPLTDLDPACLDVLLRHELITDEDLASEDPMRAWRHDECFVKTCCLRSSTHCDWGPGRLDEFLSTNIVESFQEYQCDDMLLEYGRDLTNAEFMKEHRKSPIDMNEEMRFCWCFGEWGMYEHCTICHECMGVGVIHCENCGRCTCSLPSRDMPDNRPRSEFRCNHCGASVLQTVPEAMRGKLILSHQRHLVTHEKPPKKLTWNYFYRDTTSIDETGYDSDSDDIRLPEPCHYLLNRDEALACGLEVEEEGEGPAAAERRSCSWCGKSAAEADSGRLRVCSRCRSCVYCTRACQIAHWKGGHRQQCPTLRITEV